MCLITLSFSTSLESEKAYRICIQLVAAIVLHPHKALLCRLPELWLPLFVNFVPYLNRAFSLDSDSAMSLLGTRTRASTNE